MTSKYLAITGLLVLLATTGVQAEAYQRGDVFKLDINRAALAPNPIGPPAQFEPQAAPIVTEAAAEPAAKPAGVARPAKIVKPRVASVRPRLAVKPRTMAAARPRIVANRKATTVRRNPLDANASDTHVQVWPCRSGGICSWRK